MAIPTSRRDLVRKHAPTLDRGRFAVPEFSARAISPNERLNRFWTGRRSH